MQKEYFSKEDLRRIGLLCSEVEDFGVELSKKYGIQEVFHAFGVVLGAWVAQQPGNHDEEAIAHVAEAMRHGAKAQRQVLGRAKA